MAKFNLLNILEQLSPEFKALVKPKYGKPRGVAEGEYQFSGEAALRGVSFSDEALALELTRRAESILKNPKATAEQKKLANEYMRGARVLTANVKARKGVRAKETAYGREYDKGGDSRTILESPAGAEIVDPDDARLAKLREILGAKNVVTPEEMKKVSERVLQGATPSMKFRVETIAGGDEKGLLLRPAEMEKATQSILMSRRPELREAIKKGILPRPKRKPDPEKGEPGSPGFESVFPRGKRLATDPSERIAVMRASKYGSKGGRPPILRERPTITDFPKVTPTLGAFLRGAKIKIERSKGELMISHAGIDKPVPATEILKQATEALPKLQAAESAARAAFRKFKSGTPDSNQALVKLRDAEAQAERMAQIKTKVELAIKNAERETKLPVTRENLMSIGEAAAKRREQSAANKASQESRHFDTPQESRERLIEESGAVEGAAIQGGKKSGRRGPELTTPRGVPNDVATALEKAAGSRPKGVPADIQAARREAKLPPLNPKQFRRLVKGKDLPAIAKSLGVKIPANPPMQYGEKMRSSRDYVTSALGGFNLREGVIPSQFEKARSAEAIALTKEGKAIIEKLNNNKSSRSIAADVLKMRRNAAQMVSGKKMSQENAESILNTTVESLMSVEGGEAVLAHLGARRDKSGRMIRPLAQDLSGKIIDVVKPVTGPAPEQPAEAPRTTPARKPATGRLPFFGYATKLTPEMKRAPVVRSRRQAPDVKEPAAPSEKPDALISKLLEALSLPQATKGARKETGLQVRRTAAMGLRSPSQPRTKPTPKVPVKYPKSGVKPLPAPSRMFSKAELKAFKQYGIDVYSPVKAPYRGGKTDGQPVERYQVKVDRPGQKAGRPTQGPNPRQVLTPDEIQILLRIAREKRAKGTYRGVRRPENAPRTA